ncbi:MAG TPA: chorismate-binding protein [Bacteriovoracaceae bacterium]|nr:chorismate-binding protein [Bacteriovoracaceae bacterium]
MLRGPGDLAYWLTPEFFLQGAFITCAQTGDILLGKGGEVTHTQDLNCDAAFYLKDFYQSRYICYRPIEWLKTSRSDLLKALKDSEQVPPITSSKTFDDLYAKDFELLKSSFNANLEKVVLISREEFQLNDPLKARAAFFQKALSFGAGMPYGLWFDGYGVVGSTPELLYHLKENNLTTFALAGTNRQGHEQELLNSDKDRHEHNLVIDDIKEKLAPFCTQIESMQTGITNYKEMIHLRTDIKATLNKIEELSTLTSSLSPTAALGGYPKEKALLFLQATTYGKLHPERYFGSAMGVLTKDIKQFVVSIRNIQWRNDLFFIESGGGVLPESNLEKELDEVRLKRATIKKHYL